MAQHTGRTVVVAGGRGHLGSALVETLLVAGSRVVVPYRAESHPLDRETQTDASCRRVAVRDWSRPAELTAALQEWGWRPDTAVASLGGWWLGPHLLDLEPVRWRALLESHLTSHFLVARALLPLLTGPDPVYVTLAGAAAVEPMVGSGPVSVTGAAQTMLLRALRAEQQVGGHPVARLHELRVMAAVAGDDRNLDPVATVEAAAVGRGLLDLLAEPSADEVLEVLP